MALFTLIHVVISVLGILAGLVVVGGLIAGSRLSGWTGLFLLMTILTSVTGFGFPFTRVLPPHVFGAISLVALAVCVVAYRKQAPRWRSIYVITAVTALYLNVFVLVVQLFTKTPPLAQLAPTQQEPPFAITQLVLLGLFIWLGRMAVVGERKAIMG